MRRRLMLTAVALGLLALVAPAATAAGKPPVLDGKKVSKLTMTVTTQMQDHDTDLLLANTAARLACEPPRCALIPFVYSPAKGVKADIAMTLTWEHPYSDMDLYVAQQEKSTRTKIAVCGGSFGTSEKVFLPAGTLRKGKTYVMIMDFYRTPGEKVTGTVEMPGKDTVDKTVPAAVDGETNINCTR